MTRVLVAEDETLIRLDLKGLLEAAGFEVCAEARDGEEAVELARETEPDVALLDVKMPRLDGIEAARRILDERPIPIVMVTAYGERELVSRAVEAGVFGYLVKPFRETDLLPAIATATARHEELRALRDEADSLAEALAARKAIERAKGLLMQREGLSEEEAFARLRKASQISGRPLKVVAEALIATLGLTTGLGSDPWGLTQGRGKPRPYVASSRSSSCRRYSLRLSHAANATRANGARTMSMPRAMTPSQARTLSASSMVRSMRDGGATAPVAPGVTTVTWIVDMRASAFVESMPALSSRNSARSVCSLARSTASVCASSDSVSSRALMRAIWLRTLASRFVSSSSPAWRSSIVTCWDTMRPSPERPVIASCTLATGTRTVSDALPSSPVATDDETT